MTDLDEIRKRSARLREIEREDAAWECKPFLVRQFVSWTWVLRYLVSGWFRRRASGIETWWHEMIRLRLASRYVSMREIVRDRFLVACGKPLYFRCMHFTNVIRPCRNDATWTYVGPQANGPPTPLPHHPIQCDACMEKEGPSPGYMKRVGRWHRAPSYVTGIHARASMTRPETKPPPARKGGPHHRRKTGDRHD